MTTPQPTWKPLIAQQSLSLCPPCAARLSWFWAMAELMLDGRDQGEGSGDAAGHAHSWCMACLLERWRAASLPTNASATSNWSLPQTPMGGGTSTLDKRRVRRLPQLSLFQSSSRRPEGSV